jgi:phosphoribosylaminoimidazole-succinocarboxamide synthase
MRPVILDTSLKSLPLVKRGKVRDIYDPGNDQLFIIATDRISAFDVILPDGIPQKGKVLNALSLFWFGFTGDIVGNHVLQGETPRLSREERELVEGRSMLVKKAQPFPVECIPASGGGG